MTVELATYTEAIADHSARIAAAASAHLDEPIEHCPGWTMADLVQHLTEVQWFWATVVEQRLLERREMVDRQELTDQSSSIDLCEAPNISHTCWETVIRRLGSTRGLPNSRTSRSLLDIRCKKSSCTIGCGARRRVDFTVDPQWRPTRSMSSSLFRYRTTMIPSTHRERCSVGHSG